MNYENSIAEIMANDGKMLRFFRVGKRYISQWCDKTDMDNWCALTWTRVSRWQYFDAIKRAKKQGLVVTLLEDANEPR